MPKGFTDREKELIRIRLHEKGAELFGRNGIKKTTVDDLARAAGIAKGSFYHFYETKEDLLLAILEKIEEKIQSDILSVLSASPDGPKEAFKRIILGMFAEVEKFPVIAMILNGGEFERLFRKLPEEKLRKNISIDEEFLERLFGLWEAGGIRVEYDPKVLSGAFRALFFMILHREEIGIDVFPKVMEFHVDAIAERIFAPMAAEKG